MAIFDPVKAITGTSLGDTLTNAGKGVANQLGAALPGLRNGLSRNSSSSSAIKPEPLVDKRGELSSQMLAFPADLPDQLAHFKLDIKEYRRPSADERGNDGLIGSIYLPLPSNINEQFAMTYNTAQFGPVLGDPSTLKAIGSGVNAITSLAGGNARQAAQNVRGAGIEAGKVGSSALSSVVPALLRAGVQALGSNTTAGGQFADLFLGATPNPGFALLFQSNTFRSFSYNWKLAPSSKEDSDKLTEIIRLIRQSMHPGREGFFLSFPHRVFPAIKVKNQPIFDFKPCVITGFNVDYAPGSIPAFFNDGKPLEVVISINLQETEIFTREDFANKDRTTE